MEIFGQACPLRMASRMKICKICGEEKELSDFYLRTDSGNHRPECKKCIADKQREYHLQWAMGRRYERKKEMVEQMGIKCSSCKIIYPVAVYDFHHVDPSTKEHSPTRYLLGSVENRDKIRKNCILLCANCHRVEHATHKLIPLEWLRE